VDFNAEGAVFMETKGVGKNDIRRILGWRRVPPTFFVSVASTRVTREFLVTVASTGFISSLFATFAEVACKC
jgi:hypothetical protein